MLDKLILIYTNVSNYWGVVVFIFTALAIKFGIMMERNYWIVRAQENHRLAIHHKRKVYYVITEEEYVNKILGIKDWKRRGESK